MTPVPLPAPIRRGAGEQKIKKLAVILAVRRALD